MPVRLKYAAKKTIASILYYLGILQLLQRVLLRHKSVVLMYHRVLTEEQRARTGSHPGIVVTRETFARQMKVLSERFAVLSITDFADRLTTRRPFANSSCLITFDDGWIDNYTNALPILREHGLHALVFLPVNYIGSDRVFWREALTNLVCRARVELAQHPERRPRFEGLLQSAGLARLLDLAGDDEPATISEALGALKGTNPAPIETLIIDFASELAVPLASLCATDGFMNWDQVNAMATDGVAFGGHGAEHLLLTTLSSSEVRADVGTARRTIPDALMAGVPTFSYPNGSWSPAVAGAVQELGYRLAFTTESGPVESTDSPLTLRRVNIHEDAAATVPMFLARVLGLF